MQAIILAAGMGKRLGELTKNNTKCMVEVDGVRLIERALRILDQKKLNRIILVVGYQYENLISFVNSLEIQTKIEFVINEIYDKTNNIYSLSLAKEQMMNDDTLLLESDLIFEERLIDMLLEDKRDSLALVDKFESWMDGTCIVVDQEDNITDFIPGKLLKYQEKEQYYKTVNIYKFSVEFSKSVYVPFLEAYAKVMGNNEYYETVIKLILLLDKNTIKAKRLEGELWYEIDDIQDLDIAQTLFIENDEERYRCLMKRYGGYWRYPHLQDYCYLVNPYFPTRRMKEEVESNFNVLMRQYPSGMAVNSILACKCFQLHKEHVLLGNGAAELIKSLLEELHGTLGVIRPTFEEYANRWNEKCVVYDCTQDDFTYSAQKLIDFFSQHSIDTLVLINPNNPSGYCIGQADVNTLLQWSKEQNKNLILDESFLDFANEDNVSLLSESILNENPNLYVVKSISKSYGVPGLRLGILASGNIEMIGRLKRSVAIWNINSVAEFFMQILDKYKIDYENSLRKMREERLIFFKELEQVKSLKVYPSQANYFMCELMNGCSSLTLAGKLLKKGILIKDLTPKIHNGKQYIRIAIREREENQKFIDSLKEELV